VQFEASDMLHESEVLDIDTEAIIEDEVRKATQRLKNEMAEGNDGIKDEMIKYGGYAVGSMMVSSPSYATKSEQQAEYRRLGSTASSFHCRKGRSKRVHKLERHHSFVNSRKNHGQGV